MTVVLREEPVLPIQKLYLPRRALAMLIVGIFFALAVGLLVVSFLFIHAHHGFWLQAAKVVPMPVAVVDNRVVWYRDVAMTANALEQEADLSNEEAIQRALLLEARAVIAERLGDELGVKRSDDRLVYAADLEAAVLASDKYQSDARAKAERLLLKMEQGLPFYDLAVQYSEGASAAVGGDLGYVDPQSLPEYLRTAALTLTPGVVSGVIATDESFWLAEVQQSEVTEDSQLVWLWVIEVKKDLLGAVVDREFAAAEIRQLMR